MNSRSTQTVWKVSRRGKRKDDWQGEKRKCVSTNNSSYLRFFYSRQMLSFSGSRLDGAQADKHLQPAHVMTVLLPSSMEIKRECTRTVNPLLREKAVWLSPVFTFLILKCALQNRLYYDWLYEVCITRHLKGNSGKVCFLSTVIKVYSLFKLTYMLYFLISDAQTGKCWLHISVPWYYGIKIH